MPTAEGKYAKRIDPNAPLPLMPFSSRHPFERKREGDGGQNRGLPVVLLIYCKSVLGAYKIYSDILNIFALQNGWSVHHTAYTPQGCEWCAIYLCRKCVFIFCCTRFAGICPPFAFDILRSPEKACKPRFQLFGATKASQVLRGCTGRRMRHGSPYSLLQNHVFRRTGLARFSRVASDRKTESRGEARLIEKRIFNSFASVEIPRDARLSVFPKRDFANSMSL